MRMSHRDRRMAIKRHPDFIKEYKEFLKLRQLNQSKPCKSNYQKRQDKMVKMVIKWREEIVAIENIEKLPEIDSEALNCIKVVRMIERRPMQKATLRTGDTEDKEIVVGDRLYLEVDLYEKKTMLKNEFSKIIDEYEDILKDDNCRNKKLEYATDIWQIYDLHYTDGLNPHQIAKRLSGINENASHNPTVSAWNRSIKKALAKANAMIERVGIESKM